MKLTFLLIFLFLLNQFSFAQKDSKSLTNDVKKELTDKSCNCISKIKEKDNNRPKQEILDDISTCIDKNIGALQVATQLSNLNLDKIIKESNQKSDTVAIKSDKDLIVDLNTDSNSYKKYYYELERELIKNCNSLRELTAGEDEESKLSFSKNQKATVFYNKGIKASKNNNNKAAAKYYKKAVKIDPNFAFAWDNLGLMYRKQKKYDKAIDAYNKSLSIDPTGPMPLQNLAVVYAYQKKYQKAIDAYTQLSEYDKDNPEIYYGIGQIQYQYLKEYEKSLDNMCIAYNLYVKSKSPYRSDAEKIINYIRNAMLKKGNEKRFNEILEKNNIRPEQ